MNELTVFSNSEFGEVRTRLIDGQPWFVGKDIAKALGYKKERNSLATHVYSEDKRVAPIQGVLGGEQEMIIINESGLYSLILSSKLPKAKEFKRWVTSEVLPSIRTKGYYHTEKYKPKATSVGEVVNLINMTRESMKEQGCKPREIALAVKDICEQFNINLPNCFVKPKETTMNDVYDMVDFIYSKPKGKGIKRPTYDDYIVHLSVKRLE